MLPHSPQVPHSALDFAKAKAPPTPTSGTIRTLAIDDFLAIFTEDSSSVDARKGSRSGLS